MKFKQFALVLFCLCFELNAKEARSVYQISPAIDGTVIAATSLISAIPYLCAPGLINRRCPCNPDEINSFDRPAVGNNSVFARRATDFMVTSAIIGPLIYEYFDVGWNSVLLEDTVVFAEVLAVNSALVTVVKFLVQRPVPLAYSGEWANDNEGYLSFYSGHTSTFVSALAGAAMTLNFRHDLGALPWIATGVLATAMGLGRVAGGTHFYTDVIVGGLVGASVGILVPWLHKKESTTTKFMLLPIGNEGVQLSLFRAL